VTDADAGTGKKGRGSSEGEGRRSGARSSDGEGAGIGRDSAGNDTASRSAAAAAGARAFSLVAGGRVEHALLVAYPDPGDFLARLRAGLAAAGADFDSMPAAVARAASPVDAAHGAFWDAFLFRASALARSAALERWGCRVGGGGRLPPPATAGTPGQGGPVEEAEEAGGPDAEKVVDCGFSEGGGGGGSGPGVGVFVGPLASRFAVGALAAGDPDAALRYLAVAEQRAAAEESWYLTEAELRGLRKLRDEKGEERKGKQPQSK